MSESDDRIQRALNNAKKKELEERYGGVFGPTGSSLPPEIEADWLHDIEELERTFEHVESTTVRQYLGDPDFVPVDCIPEHELSRALERLMDLLEDHGVEVHTFSPVTDEELYRFITEELVNEEIDDIHMEGLTQDFVYELFHPNDVLEATFFAERFLASIFRGRPSRLKRALVPTQACGDPDIADPCSTVYHAVQIAFQDVGTFLSHTATTGTCRVVGPDAVATVAVEWSALRKGSMDQFCGTTEAVVELRKDPQGKWPVVTVRLSNHAPDRISPPTLDKRPPNCVL